jgi:hypothetical protein
MAKYTAKIPDWSRAEPVLGRDFSIFADEWPIIEKAYGHPIPQSARDEIERSIRSYIDHIGGEQKSASIRDAKDKVTRLQKALITVSVAMSAPSGDPDLDAYVDRRLNRMHQKLYGQRNDPSDDEIPAAEFPLREFRAEVEKWIAVCDLTAQDLKSNSASRGRQPGEGWNDWVRAVSEVCDKHGLPRGNRKDDVGEFSPFTKLIFELQEISPHTLRYIERKALPDAIRAARIPKT